MLILSKNTKETYNLGKLIASKCKKGCVIGLVGNLGSGKTVFAKGFIKQFGSKQKVLSPTFILIKRHKTNKQNIKTIYHIDYYRANSQDKILKAQIKEYIQNNTIVIIEWADKIKRFLPKNTIWIKFKPTKIAPERKQERKIEINTKKPKYGS